MQRMTSLDRFSDAVASHTAKSLLQNSVITFCEIKIRPILLNTNKTALINVFVLTLLSYPSRSLVGPNLEIPFYAQQCSVNRCCVATQWKHISQRILYLPRN